MSACTTRKRSARCAWSIQPTIGGLTWLDMQAARVLAIQTAYRKAELNQGRENMPTAGQIRNLGLLGKEEDTKKVLGTSS